MEILKYRFYYLTGVIIGFTNVFFSRLWIDEIKRSFYLGWNEAKLNDKRKGK